MNNINTIINDIQDLRGKEVTIFGTKTLIGEPSPYEIDVVQFLESLKCFESGNIIEEYNEVEDTYEETEINDIEEYLNYLDSIYGLKEIQHSNSYNWGANISNHIDYIIYDCGNDRTYVELKVHRYGDVRCNYTESCLLEFIDISEFNECLIESYKYEVVHIDNEYYILDINIYSEGIEVYNKTREEEVGTIYGYYDTEEEVIKDIKEELLVNA